MEHCFTKSEKMRVSDLTTLTLFDSLPTASPIHGFVFCGQTVHKVNKGLEADNPPSDISSGQ